MPLTKTAKITEYTAEGFSFSDQLRLIDTMVAADARGAKIIYTNADRQFLRDLFSTYPQFKVETIVMARLSSGSVKGRGKVNEILVTNF
jgi:site-specific DNA-adenine methylase